MRISIPPAQSRRRLRRACRCPFRLDFPTTTKPLRGVDLMKRLHLVPAILASACLSAFAAQPNQTRFILQSHEGTPLKAGDALVANGAGDVALFRGNALVAVLHDPEDLVATRDGANTPIYVTDAEGSMVRGDLANYHGEMFVSSEAPEIIYYKKEFIDSKPH